MQRSQSLALGRAGCDEDPSLPAHRPLGCTPCLVLRLFLGRQHTEAVGYQSERGKNTVALLLCSLGAHGFHPGAAHSFVDLRGSGQPIHELLWIRPIGQEMGKYLLGSFSKEFTLFVARRLIE